MSKNLTISLALLVGIAAPTNMQAQTCTNPAMRESTPTSSFEFHADGTVTHKTTGLMWKRCLEGQVFSDNGTPENFLDDQCSNSETWVSWKEALDHVQAVNSSGGFAGYIDWRIPNFKELHSIVESCRFRPTLNTDALLGGGSFVWSSSPVVNYPENLSESWDVNFDDGDGGWDPRSGGHLVRLVRGQ